MYSLTIITPHTTRTQIHITDMVRRAQLLARVWNSPGGVVAAGRWNDANVDMVNILDGNYLGEVVFSMILIATSSDIFQNNILDCNYLLTVTFSIIISTTCSNIFQNNIYHFQ